MPREKPPLPELPPEPWTTRRMLYIAMRVVTWPILGIVYTTIGFAVLGAAAVAVALIVAVIVGLLGGRTNKSEALYLKGRW